MDADKDLEFLWITSARNHPEGGTTEGLLLPQLVADTMGGGRAYDNHWITLVPPGMASGKAQVVARQPGGRLVRHSLMMETNAIVFGRSILLLSLSDSALECGCKPPVDDLVRFRTRAVMEFGHLGDVVEDYKHLAFVVLIDE